MMSMAQPGFGQPAAMQQHPAIANHPMNPNLQSNPAQSAGGQQPGQVIPQSVHPSVSVPGGVQVSQGGSVMGVMPPGAGAGPGGAGGPSAHALSHLNPVQAQHIFQQHQQQAQQQAQHQAQLAQALANNPQLLQQQQQQHLIRQKTAAAQQQAMLQAQQQGHGVPVSLPNGINPSWNSAQLGQMQAGGVNLPPHIRNQLANQQASQQAQTQAQQQQLLAQHFAQHSGMQQMNANDTRPPTNQSGQPVAQQIPNAQAIAAAQQHNAAQAQHAAQQQQQQQQANAASGLIPQQRIPNSVPYRGNCILQLVLFGNMLSQAPPRSNSGRNTTDFFQPFVNRFYTTNAVLRHQLLNSTDASTKDFEITFPALARYWYTHFVSGVRHIQIAFQSAQEKELPDNGHFVECKKASFIYWFENGSQLVATGTLSVQFDHDTKIEVMSFVTQEHTEYIPRAQVNNFLRERELDQNSSPKQTKAAGKQKAQQKQSSTVQLPATQVNRFGITTAVMAFLEIAETFSTMQPLFHFSQQSPHVPLQMAMRQIVAQYQSAQGGNFNMVQNPNPNIPPGARTPGLGQPSGPGQFSSPAAAHLNLPGSPHVGITGQQHTPSPAQNHMQAPGLAAQHSQQGTNSSQATSANTSPNVTNKRRRASAVKAEGDDPGGGQANGVVAKVKASPKVGSTAKRQKANPS